MKQPVCWAEGLKVQSPNQLTIRADVSRIVTELLKTVS
jgi:hypothetical protein